MYSIHKVHGTQVADGAGAEPVRLFPTHSMSWIDPFLLMDHFAIQAPMGFPSHPHRGFEIITYVLEGAVAHADNAGYESVIPTGGLQRVIAGRGIVHSEMPGSDGINSGLQLWINLPRSEKGIDPSYQEVLSEELPEITANGVRLRTLVGDGSPVTVCRPMVYFDIHLDSGATHELHLPENYRGFVYVLTGAGSIGEPQTSAETGDLLAFTDVTDTNNTIPVHADTQMRLVFVAGQPVGERPRFNGPFVD